MLTFSKLSLALAAIGFGLMTTPGNTAASNPAPATLNQPAAARAPSAAPSAPPVMAPMPRLAAWEKTAMRGVVRRHLVAFRDREIVLAFSLAAPEVQVKFGSASRFFGYLARFYRPIFFPESVFFDGVEETAGGPVQRVFLTGPQGRRWQARFTMMRIESGEWRIADCQLTPAPGLNA